MVYGHKNAEVAFGTNLRNKIQLRVEAIMLNLM